MSLKGHTHTTLRYRHNSSQPQLGAHRDHKSDDELSVVVQLTAGAFFFVYAESQSTGVRPPPTPPSGWLPLKHMAAGEAVVYHGGGMYHGCRRLQPGEERWVITLFYGLDRRSTRRRYGYHSRFPLGGSARADSHAPLFHHIASKPGCDVLRRS